MLFSAVPFLQRKVVTDPTVVPELALVIGKVGADNSEAAVASRSAGFAYYSQISSHLDDTN